jgi:septal ring factor EnvC (AmiA/AmiB activator)
MGDGEIHQISRLIGNLETQVTLLSEEFREHKAQTAQCMTDCADKMQCIDAKLDAIINQDRERKARLTGVIAAVSLLGGGLSSQGIDFLKKLFT